MEEQSQPKLMVCVAHRVGWELSKIFTKQSKTKWPISTFKLFKPAGADGILPALLQQGVIHLITHLCHIFTACLARRYIPKAWRQVKVMFILEPGKAKAFCPISL
jgi:hypothetical protein